MNSNLIWPLLAIALLPGCLSMTGLTGNEKFACKAPDGVSCTSVSGVYANAQQNNLPALQSSARAAAKAPEPAAATDGAPVRPGTSALPVLAAGMPIRSQPRMLRVWIAPWRDEDDTLHDQSYLYVMIDPGQWQVEHSRAATVQRTMRRLQPLGAARTPAIGAGSPVSGTARGTAAGQLANVRDDASAQQSARDAAVVPGDPGD
ncbi:hypothetical protein ASF61_21345 [Duganella sp. Leaf126]|uniref:type IV conjugative transfer system lipoprotein TraV n=1 Tax=Duganella sp. Leaf126 TaxID=1736266 RepID=UPI0007005A09|nr:type IV conjugative transfer system lipoprotein TraV [Duganella sp. Leaf126]KQQ44676.1 hypothetical protein ASF61_21345 [Duganella sp. Leaf126]